MPLKCRPVHGQKVKTPRRLPSTGNLYSALRTPHSAPASHASHGSARVTARVAPQKTPDFIGSARVHGYRGVRGSLPRRSRTKAGPVPFLILIFLLIFIVPPTPPRATR